MPENSFLSVRIRQPIKRQSRLPKNSLSTPETSHPKDRALEAFREWRRESSTENFVTVGHAHRLRSAGQRVVGANYLRLVTQEPGHRGKRTGSTLPETPMIPVLGYVRVSRVGGRGGDSFLSPELQRESIELLAKREGLKVVEIVEELDASGGDAGRPLWNRCLERIEAGEVRGLAVWNLSRFSRSLKDALNALERIESSGGRLYSATEQFGDDPNSRMMRNILLSVAENGRERSKLGFQTAAASAIDRGIYIASRIPFGYVRDGTRRLAPDPMTGPIVQGLFERRAKGMSWAKLARWATEQGHSMTDKGVEYLVRNRAYLGIAHYGDMEREDAHPALVSKALFAKCQTRGKRHSSRDGYLTNRFLLCGVATCAGCGKYLRLSSSGRKKKNPFYYCRNAHCAERAYANAASLDAVVLNILYGTDETGPGLIDELAEAYDYLALKRPSPGELSRIEEAEFALKSAESDLDAFLADTELITILGREKFNDSVVAYVAAVNAAREQLERAREDGNEVASLGRFWLDWNFQERHEWLDRMIEHCVVRRGREPLSERTEVVISV